MKKSVSAGGVVIGPSANVLVVSQNGDSWSLPKGTLEPGENLQQAARREVAEESGITELVLVKELGTYERFMIGLNGVGEDKDHQKILTFFLYTTAQKTLQPTDPHNPEAKWVHIDEVAALLTHPKDKEFFDRVSDQVKQTAASLPKA